MRLEEFLSSYPDVLFSHDGDEIFSFLRLTLNGMCSVRMAKLLNFASRFMQERECYLEIGTYAGFTLLSASYESGKQFVGVDNFSENHSLRSPVKQKLQENLDRYSGGCTVLEGDFRKIALGRMLEEGLKIGVFLVDGKHTYEDVMESVQWAKPYLADQALIVFDDLNVEGVAKAVQDIKKDPCFDEVFHCRAPFDQKPDRGMSSNRYVHNGFSLLTFRRIGGNS